MSIRKTALALALTGALGLPAAANAVTIAGINIAPGALFEFAFLAEGVKTDTDKTLNADGTISNTPNGIIDVAGEVLQGVGQIKEITDGNTNVLWSDGDNGRELTFTFFYDAENFGTDGTNQIIGFTGGVVTVYSGTSLDPTKRFERNGTMADDIARASDGDVFLTLAGSPIGNAVTPEVGSLSGLPITLRSIGTSLTTGTVDGRGNLDVTGGLAGSFLDTNMFGCASSQTPDLCATDTADKVFTSSGQLRTPNAVNDWGFVGTGELQDYAIPEPGTLALLGLGLAGLGYRARRESRKG